MRIIAIDEDNRSNCISVLTEMLLEEYKRLAFDSFSANGNFEGQRGVITKSAAAARIRKRMQDDFCRGTIFPQFLQCFIWIIALKYNYVWCLSYEEQKARIIRFADNIGRRMAVAITNSGQIIFLHREIGETTKFSENYDLFWVSKRLPWKMISGGCQL